MTIDKENINYPKSLLNIHAPPQTIYCEGNIDLLNSEKIVAVVGSRHPSIYGEAMTRKFVKDFSSAGAVVVSGLAYGN